MKPPELLSYYTARIINLTKATVFSEALPLMTVYLAVNGHELYQVKRFFRG